MSFYCCVKFLAVSYFSYSSIIPVFLFGAVNDFTLKLIVNLTKISD